jgi:YHS domain-containing protein
MIIIPPRAGRAAFGLSLALAMFCAPNGGHVATAEEPDAIAWRDDYGSALEEARAANRLLWIQFTGPWCPNCTRMERDSFSHPVVVQHARESFIPVKLRSDVHEQLAVSFNLSALPATIIVAPTREVVAVHQGYLGPAEFDAFLRESLSLLPAKAAPPGAETERSGTPARAAHDRMQRDAEEHLALGGYCAVSLIRDRKLVRGQTEYKVRHEGRTYRFASPTMSELFRNDPESYLPANNGSCPVTQLERGKAVPGDPRWGMLFKSHLFLFASEEDRRRFVKEPERYAMVDVAEQGFCVHCIRDTGILVRGDPGHELARDGQRYWFPDASHRDAFVAALRSNSPIKLAR